MEKTSLPEPTLPSGTVTFLFSDIEGSTKLLRQLGDEYAKVLADQRRILRAVFTKWHGSEVDTQGDSFFVSFPTATEAVDAAVEIQRSLAEHMWSQDVQVRIRMGLHTGEPLATEEGYVGIDVHRAARIAHVGHGGQVLLSATTAELVIDELPDGVRLLDLGRHRLKDIARPEHIRQLVIRGLPSEFPPLKSLEALSSEGAVEEPVRLPAFLEEDAVEEPEPVFVGRETELERLFIQLEKAADGQGGVFFVAGDAGSGKTALLDAFSRQAQVQVPDLLVTQGNCNAFTGAGDPYAPFRTVLRQLTGDVETAWKGEAISREGARRLWSLIPTAAKALIKYGPNLIDTFIPGPALLERVGIAAPANGTLLGQIKEMAEREKAEPGSLKQQGLFEEIRDVLMELSDSAPLLILLDDLQWVDSGSINLLFHLGRELAGARIFLVGAYRPEDLVADDGKRHPLQPLLDQFKRTFGDVWLDLNQAEGQLFVDQFLETEPNLFGDAFSRTLFQHTDGHPLFTVELLRDLQERGDLITDEEGRWIEGPELDWSELPARVEGVIGERIGRLEEKLREILTVAAVEGENFTAQVVASVQKVQERQLLRTLSRELERQHQLVSERQPVRIGNRNLSRYRFTHTLFQRYMYNDLGLGERQLLHGEIGELLEELYSGNTEEITVQLARHYAEADIGGKAVVFLLQAGDQARGLYAHREAIDHYRRALVFLMEQGELERAARTLMKLGLTFHLAFNFEQSRQAYDEGFTLWQRAALMEQVVPPPPAPHALRLTGSEPVTLDPAMSSDIISGKIFEQIFSGLMELGPELDLLPDVARSWEVLDGGHRYIFHLRENARWSDGLPVTAGDFEFAWKRVLHPATESKNPRILYDIKGARAFHHGEISDAGNVGVSAIDPLTLSVELEDPAGYFLYLLAHSATYPVPRHTVETLGSAWTEGENIVTNGPFRLEKWLPGKTMTFSRNPDFHLRPRGNVQRVVLSSASGPSPSTLQEYEAGNLDAIRSINIPQNLMARTLQRHPDEYIVVPQFLTKHLAFDVSRPPFNDRRVRRAFAMTVNQEMLGNVALQGWARPAMGGYIPPGILGHSPDIGLPFDPRQARRLLAEAGYPGGAYFPTIETAVNKGVQTTVEFLSAQWCEYLGIEITWDYLDFAAYIKKLHQESSHMNWFGWIADYPDPDSFLRTGNLPKWRSDTFDDLVEQARRISNQHDRMRLYRKADRMLVEQAVVVPLLYGQSHWLVKPWVRNFVVLNYLDAIWKYIIIDPH